MRNVPTADGKKSKRAGRLERLKDGAGKHVPFPNLSDLPLTVRRAGGNVVEVTFRYRGADVSLGDLKPRLTVIPKFLVTRVARALCSHLRIERGHTAIFKAMAAAWVKSPVIDEWMADVVKYASVAEVLSA